VSVERGFKITFKQMDLKNLTASVAQIAEDNGITEEEVVQIVEDALAAAYKEDYGETGQHIKAEFDSEKGEVLFWQVKTIVEDEEKDKSHFNSLQQITLSEALKEDEDLEVGDEVRLSLPAKTDFGRIAAQTAKQVLLQKVKEAQREAVYSEYKQKEGEVVSGIVQRIEQGSIHFDLGRGVMGALPPEEQSANEDFRPGQRKKLYVLSVDQTTRGPAIFLSRAYPKLVSRLFELEVPEIIEGQLIIKSIAREPGHHSKVAVASVDASVDPIGAMVGQRGMRIMAVTNELNGEKIDIIRWSEDPREFVTNALSPAKITRVDFNNRNEAKVIAPTDQISLVIGRKGQNVRLAARLTGWKIDVRDESGQRPTEDEPVQDKSADSELTEAAE
jgi:transcription termination/antitermination protein NusA